MKDSILAIQTAAIKLGACDKIDKVDGFPSLGRLFFSPQGQEFCEKHNFPTIDTFREIKDEVIAQGVYVDRGDIELPSQPYICLVGDTYAEIRASGVEYVHTILLMHGASATIEASNYAVLRVVNISGRNIEIIKDSTVKVL